MIESHQGSNLKARFISPRSVHLAYFPCLEIPAK